MSGKDDSSELQHGNRIRIISGTFENFEAVVAGVSESGKVSAEIWIFGKCTPVDLAISEVERIPWRKPDDGASPSTLAE